jgi:hypothetical protein
MLLLRDPRGRRPSKCSAIYRKTEDLMELPEVARVDDNETAFELIVFG